MEGYDQSRNPAGITTVSGDPPNEFVIAGRDRTILLNIKLVSTAVDSSDSHLPTTRLREGLILGRITATGKYKEWALASSDGSQVPVGILNHGQNMLGPDDVVADQPAVMLIPTPGVLIDHAKLWPASNANTLAALQASGAMFTTDLIADYPFADGALISRCKKIDCAAAAAAAITLIDAGLNPNGLVVVDYFGVLTEVMAGDTEDQGIVNLEDSDAGTLAATLTPTDAGADALGDIIQGAGTNKSAGGATTNDPGINVPAHKGLCMKQSQLCSGANLAGKMLVCVTAIRKPAV